MYLGIWNTPRDYAWGSTTAIPVLLGTTATGKPQAELWLGAHPGSPSQIVGEPGRTLIDVVPERLPFLLKVLAAAAPLSLQAHPTPAQAEAGFARENAAGIPLDAPERNYKDPFHKPELIYALSDTFRALCGFRPVAETLEVLDLLDDARIAPLRDRLVDDSSLRPVFEWLISRGDGVDGVIDGLVEGADMLDGISWEVVALLARDYPGDPGIAISVLLHAVDLAPGEVLYLPAGNIHAYLGGLGIELMAASDNVLRGGLTPKHVDVPELLEVLDFRPLPLPYLVAEEPQPGLRIFRPDVPDFVLTVATPVALAAGVRLPLTGPAIALCTAGAASLAGGRSLSRGEAVFIEDESLIELHGDGTVFVASTGVVRS